MAIIAFMVLVWDGVTEDGLTGFLMQLAMGYSDTESDTYCRFASPINDDF